MDHGPADDPLVGEERLHDRPIRLRLLDRGRIRDGRGIGGARGNSGIRYRRIPGGPSGCRGGQCGFLGGPRGLRRSPRRLRGGSRCVGLGLECGLLCRPAHQLGAGPGGTRFGRAVHAGAGDSLAQAVRRPPTRSLPARHFAAPLMRGSPTRVSAATDITQMGRCSLQTKWHSSGPVHWREVRVGCGARHTGSIARRPPSPHLACVKTPTVSGQRRRLANGTMVMSLKSCPKARGRVPAPAAVSVRSPTVRSGVSSNRRRRS
jgi:hypothetical protein